MDKSDKQNVEGEIILSEVRASETLDSKLNKNNISKKIQKHGAHFFSAFAQNPSNVIFQFQEPDEEIILLIRKHIITNVPWIIFALLLILAPIIATPIIVNFFSFITISGSMQSAILLTYYLALTGYVLVNFSLWYFHVGLVTSHRIIDIDFTNVLIKHVSETRIDLIEDVSYTQVGAIRTIFNYGDLLIQTAGTKPNIEFDKASRPAVIADIVGDLIQDRKDEDS